MQRAYQQVSNNDDLDGYAMCWECLNTALIKQLLIDSTKKRKPEIPKLPGVEQ